jgi:hypothetical protein
MRDGDEVAAPKRGNLLRGVLEPFTSRGLGREAAFALAAVVFVVPTRRPTAGTFFLDAAELL